MPGDPSALPRGAGSGGSLSLAAVIDEYAGEIYRDFEHYYPNFSWDDLFAGKIHPGFVLEMIFALPRGSYLAAKVAGGEYEWRYFLGVTDDYDALAAVVDAVNTNTVVTYRSAGGKKKAKFDPYPTPTSAAAEAKQKRENPVSLMSMYQMFTAAPEVKRVEDEWLEQ